MPDRTVYFYEPIVVDKKGLIKVLPRNFWDSVHADVSSLPLADRQVSHFGREIEGEARKSTSPAASYFYVDRKRLAEDWPDAKGSDGKLKALASHGTVKSLHEPAYLLNVGGTNYIAMVRSSAGPSTSAIERWVNVVMNFTATEDTFELRPLVRNDQLTRLQNAVSASKVHLRIEADQHIAGGNSAGEIEQALAIAQNISSGSVSIDMTLSFGNAKPDDAGGAALVDNIRKLIQSNIPFKQLGATVIVDSNNGETEKDFIDFTRDRITIRQAIGFDQDEQPTPQVVLEGLFDAIKKYKSL